MRRVPVPKRTSNGEGPWYTNKELFEMFQGIKDEMRETRAAIREYNGLRKLVNEVMTELASIKSAQLERYNVGKTIREWGGWILGIASFVFALWTYFGR